MRGLLEGPLLESLRLSRIFAAVVPSGPAGRACVSALLLALAPISLKRALLAGLAVRPMRPPIRLTVFAAPILGSRPLLPLLSLLCARFPLWPLGRAFLRSRPPGRTFPFALGLLTRSKGCAFAWPAAPVRLAACDPPRHEPRARAACSNASHHRGSQDACAPPARSAPRGPLP